MSTTIERTAERRSAVRWATKYPELGTGPVPIDSYISASYYELERDKIFRKVWLMVAREEQLPEVGSYLVKDLKVARTSLLLVRTEEGIRAFHNVCSHRSNKLVWDPRGKCRTFSCGFHGWTYTLDGRLKLVPDEASFACLNKEELGLTPVRSDVWNGFVFVNLDPEPRETLREYLGEVADRLDEYPFAECSQSRHGWSMELAANFKIAQNAQQESYHNAFTHTRTLSFSRSKSNPFGHCLYLDLYSKHCFISSEGNPDYKPTPVGAAAAQFSAVMGINDANRLPAALNPTKSPSWAADGYIIFPNFVLSVNVGMYVVQQFWPLAQDRTLYEVRIGTGAKRTAGERFAQEYGRVFIRDVLMEEMSTVEKSQEVYASGAKRHLILHDEEIMIRHDLRVRDEYVRRPD